MTTVNKNRDERLQHDLNRETISALSSGNIDKYKYLKGIEILPSDNKER